ncbi:MAG: hypothetical protein DLM58_12910 [Pseudonocardiales bacterium]|nr:MAG: hypothetical protein DLM58_12910 [Pseudonocardiales bacterium]
MLTQEEFVAARAVAAWNTAHGGVLPQITEACGAVSDACSQALAAPSEENYAGLRAAGARLQTAASAALDGPWAGVDEYDDPRRRALECYREAGELAARFDPSDEEDPRGEHAAALIFKGTQITSQATAFARDLLTKARES